MSGARGFITFGQGPVLRDDVLAQIGVAVEEVDGGRDR